LIELNLRRFSNHDLIALGMIMKRFIRLSSEHFYFWHKFLESVKERENFSELELKRIKMILENMGDFL
jgi:hypothetical protein